MRWIKAVLDNLTKYMGVYVVSILGWTMVWNGSEEYKKLGGLLIALSVVGYNIVEAIYARKEK